MTTRKTIKSAFESMMFVWGDPLDAKTAANAMNIDRAEALECFRELAGEYDEQGRGIRIREIDGKFQFITYDENFDYIRSIVTPAKERRLTQAALETLAIIAYKQPVTKGEIDSIRGIRSERVIDGLMKKGLVCERGRGDAVGRPILYGTTDLFLTNFDLKTIKELPQIEDIEEAIQYADPMTAMDARQTSLDLEEIAGATEQSEAAAPPEADGGENAAAETAVIAASEPQSTNTGSGSIADTSARPAENVDSNGGGSENAVAETAVIAASEPQSTNTDSGSIAESGNTEVES